jgi:formylglycine-generating enzyme required for sulfatase activity
VAIVGMSVFFAGADSNDKGFAQKNPVGLGSFEMVAIPGGEITLPGAKEPATIKPFYMSETEVTWDMYDPYMLRLDLTEKQQAAGVDADSRPSKPYGNVHKDGNSGYPAIYVALKAAEDYCKWLSAKTGREYRLPTEAEWMYACQAGNKSGATISADELKRVAWFSVNSDDKSHPVAKKQANAFGLYDMLGNVAEWVIQPDGKCVVAGGSWMDDAADVSCAARQKYSEDWQSSDPEMPKSKWWLSDADFVGFRIVCEKE